jgi:hypothetical protein
MKTNKTLQPSARSAGVDLRRVNDSRRLNLVVRRQEIRFARRTQMQLFAYILPIAAIAVIQSTIADDNSKPSAESHILECFVGTWDMDVTIKPVGAGVVNVKRAETRSWSPGKTVVHFENAKVAGANEASASGPEFHMFLTYDAATKSFRGMMRNGAGRSLITGTWDEATSTMTFNGTHWTMKARLNSRIVFSIRTIRSQAESKRTRGVKRSSSSPSSGLAAKSEYGRTSRSTRAADRAYSEHPSFLAAARFL